MMILNKNILFVYRFIRLFMVTGLVENLRNIPKEHKVSLLILSYRRLEHWIDWQCGKQEVPVITVKSRGTSLTCPKMLFKAC